MRTLRLFLLGTAVLALLGGLNGAFVGAEESDARSVAITPVTGTLLAMTFDDSEEEFSYGKNAVGQARGARLEETFQYDDDRLPPVRRSILNFDMHPILGMGKVWVLSSTIRLDGPDGYWTGTGRWFGPVDSTWAGPDVHTGGQDVLVGHGAYEGLTAVLGCDGVTCSGYIFEGEMPPLPDPVGPPVE